MKVISDAEIYVEGKGIIRGDILFDNKIQKIGKNLEGEKIEIPEDYVVVPGFIDEHTHGIAGVDTMDSKIETLEIFSRELLKEGTTAFLPTTMSQTEENIKKALRNLNEFLKNEYEGALILGVHLEGPFISKLHKGAQLEECIESPNIKLLDSFIKESNNRVKLITIAPEEEGGFELIRHLKKNNIIASIGHSDAKYEDVKQAIECGASCVTHVFNAQSVFHHRELGVAGSALIFDELACELIADGFHVCFPAIRLLIKNKPEDKVILITDAIRAKGISVSECDLGGQRVIIKDGAARLEEDEHILAGSILYMNVAVKNIVQKAGVKFETAIDFATINPAKNLKIEHASMMEINENFDILDME